MSATASDSPRKLTLGEKLPDLEVQTPDGRPVTVSYVNQQAPTVLYVFTPTCPWCRRNRSNISALAAERNKSYRFLGLSLDPSGLTQYLRENPLPFPVYTNP